MQTLDQHVPLSRFGSLIASSPEFGTPTHLMHSNVVSCVITNLTESIGDWSTMSSCTSHNLIGIALSPVHPFNP